MRKKLRKVLALFIATAICVSTTDINAFAAQNSNQENVGDMVSQTGEVADAWNVLSQTKEVADAGNAVSSGDSISEKEVLDNWDSATTQSVYEDKNFKVIFSLTSQWEGGYNAGIKIENTGENAIENWYLSFDSDNQISGIWNAEISGSESGKYIIKNADWNQDIPIGEYVEFGFSGIGDFLGFPVEYQLLGSSENHKEEDYTIEYCLDSDWGAGFTGRISVTNNTEETIEDWTLAFAFDRTILTVWDGVLESQENNSYIIKNVQYNSSIAPGQTVSFGFTGEGGNADNIPYNYQLSSYQLENTEYIQLADGRINKDYLERAIYPYLLMKGMSLDDIRLADDYDGDGLTLEEEYDYDTNPFAKDTDEDGVDDYLEIHQYGTNPIKYDTDEDGMSDGTEILCGLNPLQKDTDNNGITDGEEVIDQKVRIYNVNNYSLEQVKTLPSVQITGKGDYSQKLYATAVEYNEAILDLDCLVGTAFDFVHDESLDFESSTLSFTISEEILQKYSLSDLAIAWYNEEENALELLETYADAATSTVYAEVVHYSTYMVVSVPDYFFNIDWENEDSIIEAGKADVVFVVDTTGSMSEEIRNVKNNITTFVSNLEENKVDIRLGLVEYRDIYVDGIRSTKSYDWYTDVSDFKNKLGTLGVGGGGDTPESVVDALYCARNMKYRTGVKKYIILLTDANYKNGTSVDKNATLADEIKNLCDDEISVSVVTLPGYYSTYSNLVSQTDGVSANINQNFASALEPLIDKMDSQVNKGCWIRLSNGSIVSLDKDPTLGDETVDTDGDGIPDIFELKSQYKVSLYNPYTNKMQDVDTWAFYSNPVEVDTDGDSINDFVDLEPTVFDVVVTEQDDTHIKFNTKKQWNIIPCTSFDYLDNLLQMVDGKVDNPIPLEEMQEIVQNVEDNKKKSFSEEELIYIGLINNEGCKLYMHDMQGIFRENVFQKITGRESRYYRHSGIWWTENWSEVPKGTESGFFKGTVLSEADINFSWKIYTVCDVYSVLTSVAQIGALVIAIVLIAEATPVVLANIQGLVYYVKTFGVVQGIQMYRYLGVQNLPDGVISWLQMDMADGDSSLDDVAAVIQRESVKTKLQRYLLDKEHPEGGPKAKWFELALGFTKENWEQLAKQIVFDESVAVQTEVTQYGPKFEQIISILGANGKKIEVLFVWIRNHDGFIRLVTALPTAKK